MTYLSNHENVIEERVKIKDIPCIVLRPRNENKIMPTVILYHEWTTNKESQKFRGYILSSLGYQVIIPDSIYHGERKPLVQQNNHHLGKYFWKVILNNIGESSGIIDEAIGKYNADPDNIGVIGHSMGGFTTAGVFTHDERIKTGVVFNGSFNWEMSNEFFLNKIDHQGVFEEKEEVEKLDPMNNIDKLVDRPLLILSGAADEVVPMGAQVVFYNKIKELYRDKSNINLIQYENLGHSVNTNMMEDGVEWLELHCK